LKIAYCGSCGGVVRGTVSDWLQRLADQPAADFYMAKRAANLIWNAVEGSHRLYELIRRCLRLKLDFIDDDLRAQKHYVFVTQSNRTCEIIEKHPRAHCTIQVWKYWSPPNSSFDGHISSILHLLMNVWPKLLASLIQTTSGACTRCSRACHVERKKRRSNERGFVLLNLRLLKKVNTPRTWRRKCPHKTSRGWKTGTKHEKGDIEVNILSQRTVGGKIHPACDSGSLKQRIGRNCFWSFSGVNGRPIGVFLKNYYLHYSTISLPTSTRVRSYGGSRGNWKRVT